MRMANAWSPPPEMALESGSLQAMSLSTYERTTAGGQSTSSTTGAADTTISPSFLTSTSPRNFLFGRWGSTMRDVLGKEIFGPRLYALGRSPDVVVGPTENEW